MIHNRDNMISKQVFLVGSVTVAGHAEVGICEDKCYSLNESCQQGALTTSIF